MAEQVEKSRAWPKADNKQSKEIMELLNQEPEVIQSGRENYRHYRQQGYDLHSHNL